jgi:uncharacterized membrane protein
MTSHVRQPAQLLAHMLAFHTQHRSICQVAARDKEREAAERGVSPSVGRSEDDDASVTAAVAESDEAEEADPNTCSDDDASIKEAVPPPSPIQATQDFETQHTQKCPSHPDQPEDEPQHSQATSFCEEVSVIFAEFASLCEFLLDRRISTFCMVWLFHPQKASKFHNMNDKQRGRITTFECRSLMLH